MASLLKRLRKWVDRGNPGEITVATPLVTKDILRAGYAVFAFNSPHFAFTTWVPPGGSSGIEILVSRMAALACEHAHDESEESVPTTAGKRSDVGYA